MSKDRMIVTMYTGSVWPGWSQPVEAVITLSSGKKVAIATQSFKETMTPDEEKAAADRYIENLRNFIIEMEKLKTGAGSSPNAGSPTDAGASQFGV